MQPARCWKMYIREMNVSKSISCSNPTLCYCFLFNQHLKNLQSWIKPRVFQFSLRIKYLIQNIDIHVEKKIIARTLNSNVNRKKNRYIFMLKPSSFIKSTSLNVALGPFLIQKSALFTHLLILKSLLRIFLANTLLNFFFQFITTDYIT